MIDINSIDTINIENLVNKTIISSGKQTKLPVKDIIIADNPIDRFYESVCQNIGKGLKILFLFGQEFEACAQKLKDYFEKRGFLSSEHIIQDKRVKLASAQQIASSIQDDTRIVIAIGGGSIIKIAKIASFLRGLPLALYYVTPECNQALTCYAQAYHNNLKTLYKTSGAEVICIDLSAISQCNQNYIAGGVGILASKILALFDWYFAHIFSLQQFDYQVSEAIFQELEKIMQFSQDLIKKDKKAYLELVHTQLKISALMHLSDNTALYEGGQVGALNVLEMFFYQEDRPLRLEGENLFLCSKIVLRAYKHWLNNLKLGYLSQPDNTLRIEKLTDFLGIDELAALNNVLVIDDYEQWEIMQYKWKEYNQDLIHKITQYSNLFAKYEHTFKRVYDDAGFWTTKYLTENDIMLMIGLAPDTINRFCLLSFVKLTGQLDKYLEGV